MTVTIFRSITDLKDFNDDEWFEPDTSETEPGQAINIRAVYERCMRGELAPVRSGSYDIKKPVSDDEAFATLDPTESEDFDLADATAIADELKDKLERAKDLSTTQQGADNSKSSDARNAVDKSEDVKEQTT